MFKKLLFVITFFLSVSTFGQLLPYTHYTERSRDKSDTTSLQHFFRSGEFYGHLRYFFMTTDNESGLSDYYANAFGMGIGYETPKFKGFQFGLSGFFIYNVYSTDFTVADPKTGQFSRYELGQFDVLDPGNTADMDRLEDLYLKYNYRKSFIKFGKQHIKTPFINPQDGRMRPTLADGLMVELNEVKNIKIEGGWLYKISPRSTVDWFEIGESIGVYPTGLNPDGSRSGYSGNVHSKAVYYGGITASISKNMKIQLWNFHIENVLNSTLLQANTSFKLFGKNRLVLAGQYIEQHAVNNGGNDDISKTYVTPGNIARTFGARVGIAENDNWSLLFNYNRITKDGRYLMPREWGRDPFFTFMARERNEGYADVHAANIVLAKTFNKSGWKTEAGYGRYYLPDVSNTAFNKYAMPSYWQTNIDVRYIFSGFLNGLEMQLLYLYKGQIQNDKLDEKLIINKVNMSQINFVINFHF
jgi:hypothetical protein